MKVTTILVTLIAIATATQKLGTTGTKPSPRIVGGHEAPPHSLPYQAFLDVRRLTRKIIHVRYCSGAIISNYFILTSGRCVEGAQMVQVTLGVHNSSQIESGIVSTPVESIRVHPEYSNVDGIVKHDIALLEIYQRIPFSDHIQAISLPGQDDINSYVGHTAKVSGWGLIDGTDPKSESDVLEYFDGEVVKNSECEKVFPEEIDSSVICLEGGASVCNEDEGAPLVADSKIIGISSLWVDNCIAGNSSVYTRVTSYIDWIVQETGIVIS